MSERRSEYPRWDTWLRVMLERQEETGSDGERGRGWSRDFAWGKQSRPGPGRREEGGWR